jgi:phosphopentomutase
VAPPRGMLLDQLETRGIPVYSIGKILDIFLGRGIREYEKTKSNADGMAKTLGALDIQERGLIFVNLVDFDSLFGHRNDVEGYARALEQVDEWLPELESKLTEGDLLVLTADHGCDPTTPSTDHSREYVPLLTFGKRARAGVNLGLRKTLSDIGQTVAENFGVRIGQGSSFLGSLAGLGAS